MLAQAAPSAYSFQESALAVAAAAAAAQQQQQVQQVAAQQISVANNAPIFSPHFAPSSYATGPMQVGSYDSTAVTAARSCALPSPTIYPPTPPPSAPWIHPWYGGDTF